ncbi:MULTISPECIES: outer-membrane lipoprotein carrier protein LolA [Methylobacterium]|jgi:outer membrane lipoprotein-sorting protein|uniref:LolA family protein n=1 Tax=Methylobacterium TaxID=407 RepID=UPI00035E16D8|nr:MULTISPECIES: outer-membrane lipoprotein carrier protein LolA [Methylobacterium]MBN4092965.1 outer-membrane lipoprotein carrier protein LolA [Methylobacterium sp. OT2]UIN34626.1 outer membrane lipoprotein carrier protein LolA [Methylobacterium oryzae]SEF79520.1 Outer membrane lipoprotein-sorting protein [Methylobacterium sp. 190mf]SEN60031.1 Outer membrane lipoprotein-sorting protein [Methylobacterium sp. UNC300MFChir4.1]
MIGRRTRTAGSVIAAGLWLATANPAHAQVGAFIDSLFGHKEEPAPQPEAAPAAPAPAKKAAPKAKEASKETKPGTAKSGKGGDKAADKADHKAPEPKVAAVGAPTAIVTADSADPAALLAQANAYFNGINTLTGNFVQIGADGRRIGGKLTLVKPGRLRFDYDQPSPLEVVADGTSVAVRDRKLNTQDLYFIAQTPLKFLLREKIDLARDLTVTDVASDPGSVRISLEDRATLGGTSKIQLFFDAEMKTLSQWRITDPQGYVTTVTLSNLQKGKSVDGSLFFINYGRSEDKAMQQQIQQSQK